MISDRAYIHPDAKLGNNVTVEPFAYIAGDVVIGDDCWIGPSVAIYDGARIGKGCKIHTAAAISCLPQDLKFAGEVTTAEIGDYNDIREYVTISRGTASKGKTVVGSHNLLMAYVHIAHDDVVGSHCVFANRVSLAGEVEVGDWAIVGGHAAIHQWVRIGAHSMIQGGSLVGKDIPPYATVGGEPVRFFLVNRIGLGRRGFTPEQISEIGDMSRIIFQSGLDYLSACDQIDEKFPQSEHRDTLVGFVRGSQRGVCKPAAV
ncbi:MAG: acyl-ACP--UDP-N-acetylglucosamine O-acyltransferase [Rikenellaceae bacterium]